MEENRETQKDQQKKRKVIILLVVIAFVLIALSVGITMCVGGGSSKTNRTTNSEKHEHTIIQKSEMPPTCTTAGTIAHYECSACNKKFTDAGCKNEITNITDSTKPATGHAATPKEATNATCTTDGTIAHYECNVCNKKFRDAEYTNEITNITDADKPATGHNKAPITQATNATCTTAGTIAHYECNVCNKKFRDAEYTNVVEDITDSTKLATGHKITSKVATNATCTTAGTIAHYECNVCNKKFEDAEYTNEITNITDPDKPATGDTYNGYTNINVNTHEKIASCGDSSHNITENHDYSNGNCPCGQSSPLKLTNNGTGSSSGDTHTLTGINDVGVTQLDIPESVTIIGEKAFINNTDLTSVKIPNSVKTIGYQAFYGCSGLTSITISEGVTSIGNDAFINCKKLTSITIPNSVETIGYQAFYGCSGLTSITIPESVKTIDGMAFYDCSNLTEIIWNAESVSDPGWNGAGNFKRAGTAGTGIKVIFGDNVKSIPAKLFQPDSLDSSPKIASIKIGKSVTSIGDCALAVYGGIASKIIVDSENTKYRIAGNCLIDTETKKLIVGDNNSIIPTDGSVMSIGSEAFKGCSGLTSITIPDSVTSIDNYRAFKDCSGLTSITIPNGVTTIGELAFSGCSSLTIYCEATSIPSGWNSSWKDSSCPVVWDCKSNNKDENGYEYSIIDGIRYSLKDRVATVVEQPRNISGAITIPTSVTYDGNNYNVTSIGDRAFYYCSGLTSITIPTGVSSIGQYAFSGCSSLTSITIPTGVSSIGQYTFYNCSSLTSITIPDGVTSIGSSAFSGCSSLTIYCETAVKPSGWNNYWKDSSCPVVWDCKNKDIATDGYIYTVIDGIRYGIKDGVATVVRQPRNISGAITIPTSITYKEANYSVSSIGDRAFYNCSSLTSITIPDSVTSIGQYTFYNCSSLTSITFNGTQAQWNAISKGSSWNSSTGNYTITCTDGTISKS